MVRALHLAALLSIFVPAMSSFQVTFKVVTNTMNKDQYREYVRNKAHRYRRGPHRRPPKTTDIYDGMCTSYVPFGGQYPYDHDRTSNFAYIRRRTSNEHGLTTTFNPYVDFNMPNFPFHLYETNPYVKDAQFNFTFPHNTLYTTTENIHILYDDILRKKLTNHRARLFNNYDRHFPILFKRAWKHAVGALFFDNCDSENALYFPKPELTRSDSIYVFYEFLKKMRSCLKEMLSWHFQQIPDETGEDVFTQEKSINDIRYAFYTIENFISYDSNDIDEQMAFHNTTDREYQGHITHINEKLMKVIFPFVEKRYFNFLKNFKYPAAKDETILSRERIGNYLYKLCYKVVREIRKEPFFQFPTQLRVDNYTSDDLKVIEEYKVEKKKGDPCETCEERAMMRSKKKNRV